MSITDILIILFALAMLSLVMVSMANQREKRRRALRSQSNVLKRRLRRLEEVVIEVDQLLESRSIARLMNDEIIRLISEMRKLEPEAVYLDAMEQTAQARAESLEDESLPVLLDRLKESDVQIARARKNLEDSAAILNRLRARNRLSVEELNEFTSQLSWALLMVETISLLGQGHKNLQRNDIMTAHAYYKKAQHQLMKSAHGDPRRHRMIKEISELLTGKRSAMSGDLVPEISLNQQHKASA